MISWVKSHLDKSSFFSTLKMGAVKCSSSFIRRCFLLSNTFFGLCIVCDSTLFIIKKWSIIVVDVNLNERKSEGQMKIEQQQQHLRFLYHKYLFTRRKTSETITGKR